jgi:hypothetical protein
MKNSAQLYLEYEEKMQRSGLFKMIAENYTIQKALYPGSYIHISPSFYIPEVVYIDTDKKAKLFFADNSYQKEINKKKSYSQESIIRYHPINFQKSLPEDMNYFDLLISQYAGFVSHYCKAYLKRGGMLLVNNSHGDAGVAFTDKDYDMIGVVNYRNKKYSMSTSKLDLYFIPKNHDIQHTKEKLMALRKGLGYKKSASHYIFRRN